MPRCLPAFNLVAQSTRDSSPGPDGLPYSAWTSCPLALTCLHRTTLAMAEGAKSPTWFNAATMIMIPKKLAPGATAYAAAPAEYRPLTLANISQEIVAKAVDVELGKVAMHTVHAVQIGFVRRRAMLTSVLRLEGAVEAYSYGRCDEVGLFLFDVVAAFPSVTREVMWRVLHATHLRSDLARAVPSLEAGVVVRIAWGGRDSDVLRPVRSGVRQGCPTSSRRSRVAHECPKEAAG